MGLVGIKNNQSFMQDSDGILCRRSNPTVPSIVRLGAAAAEQHALASFNW